MDVFVETLQKLLQNFSEQLYFRLMLRSFLNCYWHTQKLSTICSFHWVKKGFWKEINKYSVFRRTKFYKNKYFKRGLTWRHVNLKWVIFHEGSYEEINWEINYAGPILEIGGMSVFFGSHLSKKGHFVGMYPQNRCSF